MNPYWLARGALFSLNAEHSHELTIGMLSRYPIAGGLLAGRLTDDPVRLMGLDFRNRVGLAAGLDKNGECVEAFDRMGFGFIEVGTITPRPQPGNPRPRMFRLPAQRALINRLGFNNQGVDPLVHRLGRLRRRAVLGINIGKNADTPIEYAEDDYLACLQKIYGVTDYVVINISSPNTANLRDLQDAERFERLLGTLGEAREKLAERHGKRRPMLVKIAPDMENEQVSSIARAARRHGIDGLIATNTTTSRDGLPAVRHSAEKGGLSGTPVFERSNKVLRHLRSCVGPDYPLVGVGGVTSATEAVQKREAGADLIQIYTGLIYRGPGLVGECARALRDAQKRSASGL